MFLTDQSDIQPCFRLQTPFCKKINKKARKQLIFLNGVEDKFKKNSEVGMWSKVILPHPFEPI